jgi:hypothetical protein
VDGVPTADSVDRLYDALDLVRGIEAFLSAVPGASLVAMRRGFRSWFDRTWQPSEIQGA